jgi:hypothetical protein
VNGGNQAARKRRVGRAKRAPMVDAPWRRRWKMEDGRWKMEDGRWVADAIKWVLGVLQGPEACTH